MTGCAITWLLSQPGCCPCGPINDVAQVFEDPQVKHRELRVEIPNALGGVTPVTRVDGRPIADGAPGPVTREASDLYLRSVGAL